MDLSMYRGDSAQWRFTITDADAAAVDLTEADVRFTAKRHDTDEDDDAVLSKTVGAGIDVTNAEAGILELTLDPEDTDDLGLPLVLVWDLQLTGAAGDVHTVAAGVLRIRADVSRTTP